MQTLIVIVGPTGVGKTQVSIDIAKFFGAEIINADSRQIYREIPIGTAAPTLSQQSIVKHHLVGCKSITDYYSASMFETDVLSIMSQRIHDISSPITVLSGGSMMYIDAVCNGIDNIPTISTEVRNLFKHRLSTEGLQVLVDELRERDYEYWQIVDKQNVRRVVHALEIIHQSGQTFMSFRKNLHAKRDFRILKIGLNLPRQELYQNIDTRVDDMIKTGLVEEAKNVLPYRNNNALNTVGYKELFNYFDGHLSLSEAIDKIKNNTHKYARKQLTWFKRDASVCWFYTSDKNEILNYLKSNIDL